MKKVLMDNEKEGVSFSVKVVTVFTDVLKYPYSYLQFPITALREIRILQLLKNGNIVNLLEICRTKGILSNYAIITNLTVTH